MSERLEAVKRAAQLAAEVAQRPELQLPGKLQLSPGFWRSQAWTVLPRHLESR